MNPGKRLENGALVVQATPTLVPFVYRAFLIHDMQYVLAIWNTETKIMSSEIYYETRLFEATAEWARIKQSCV